MDTDKIKALKEDKGVALVEFYATWCPHCQKMMPVVADVESRLEGHANVYQFDIDSNNELADELHVNTIPTFIIYKDGVEKWRASGEMDGNVLVSKVEEQL